MRKDIKKTFLGVMALTLFLSVGGIGNCQETSQADLARRYTVTNSVADTMGVSFDINAPVVIRTFEGEDISGGYCFETVNDMKSFLQGKGKNGIRANNSKKPRTNLVILGQQSADVMVKLIKLQNQATASSKSGPMYQVEYMPDQLNTTSKKSLKQIGINDPVCLLIESGKKVQPGGFLRKVGDFINPFREAAGLLGDWRTWKGWS